MQLANEDRGKKGNFPGSIRELKKAQEVLRNVLLAARDEKRLPCRVIRSLGRNGFSMDASSIVVKEGKSMHVTTTSPGP